MNKSENEVLNILKSWKKGEKYKITDEKLVLDIIKILEEQKLMETFYKTILFPEKWREENSIKINILKKRAMKLAINNISNRRLFLDIIYEFSKRGLEVILLKGIILSESYKNRDLRKMIDFDILMKDTDFKEAEKILIGKGYEISEKGGNNDIHITYIKEKLFPIELHYKLINKKYFKGNTVFEDEVFKNKVEMDIDGVKVYSLSIEDAIVHLFIHKAIHMVYGGINLRQLLDLVLFLEKNDCNINWDKVKFEIYKLNLEKFFYITLAICSEFLGYRLNFGVTEKYYNRDILRGYLREIFDKGSNIKNKSIENELAFENNYKKGYLSLIFPNRLNMSSKYDYAKKNKFLLPVAWIHHIFEGIRSKGYKFNEKKYFLLEMPIKARSKKKLLQKLELK